jgi:hypothetical protein
MIYFLNANEEWGKCQRQDKNTLFEKIKGLDKENT